jgi:hypothetical protein
VVNFDWSAAANPPADPSPGPLLADDVVGRFRRGLMIDIGTVGAGETIRWTRNLGHRNIVHTVRYTNLAPDRFKTFWRD